MYLPNYQTQSKSLNKKGYLLRVLIYFILFTKFKKTYNSYNL